MPDAPVAPVAPVAIDGAWPAEAPRPRRRRFSRLRRLVAVAAAAALVAVALRCAVPLFTTSDVHRWMSGAWAIALCGFAALVLALSARRNRIAHPRRVELPLLALAGALLLAGSWINALELDDTSRPRLLRRALDQSQSADAAQPFTQAAIDGAVAWHPQLVAIAALMALALLAHVLVRRVARDADPLLLPSVVLLLGLGIVLMSGLGPDEAAALGRAWPLGLGPGQARNALIAMIVLMAAALAATPAALRWLAQRPRTLAALGCVLLGLTFVAGQVAGGRRLWLKAGDITAMPIEPAKLLMIGFLAAYGAAEGRYFGKVRRLGIEWPRMRHALPFALLWACTFGLVVLQGDMGPAFLLLVLFLAFFHVISGSLALTLGGVAASLGGGAILYAAGWPDTVRVRIDAWLRPFETSQQVSEAAWSVAGGGWLGRGLGQDLSHRIVHVHSDFAFASFVEQAGIAGGLAVLALFAAILLRASAAALGSDEPFRRYLAFGLGLGLAIQAFVTAAGNTGLLPLTGITLPFVAHGGTSLLACAAMAGVLWRLSAGEASS